MHYSTFVGFVGSINFNILQLLLSFISLLISLYIYRFFFNPRCKPTSTTVGFKMYPFVGVLPELSKNHHRFLEWTTEVLSRCPTNTTVFKKPGMKAIFTANPLNVEHMLRTKFDNYIKGEYFSSVLEDFFGHGPFTSEGQRWKNQRKFASCEMNSKSLRNFWTENVVVEIQTRFIPLLENAAKTGKVLELEHILHCFAFDNICKLAFNVDLGCLGAEELSGNHHEFMHAFGDASSLSFARFEYPLKLFYKTKQFFNFGSEKKLKKSTKIVHEFVEKQINARLEGICVNLKDKDCLSRFMEKTKGNLAEYFVKDNVIALIFGGGEITSTALTWFFWLLSLHPLVKHKIIQELEQIRLRKMKKIGDAYDLEDLWEMNFLHAAISESMRLYPPAPVVLRLCKGDDTMPDGTFVGKNWIFGYHSYAMGRMENIWGNDCDEYKPERWLENGIFKPESPFRFPIFLAGPRMCLGKDMAYIQMKSIAASLLERFELDVLLEKGKPPEYVLSLTLQIKGGLPVRVKERAVENFD